MWRGRVLLCSCLMPVACAQPEADVPAVAESDAAQRPEIFAPGVISTAEPEFAITFTPDGATAYFTRASEDRSRLTILESRLVNGAWTEPLPAAFSGEHRDLDPFVTPDGTRLYFSSDRPASPSDTTADLDTWYVEAREDGWSEPVRPGAPYNSDSTDVFVSATRNGTLYFQSSRDGASRVWSVTPDGEARIVAVDSATATAGNPMIHPDGAFLVFVSDAGDGPDLFAACRRGAGFGEARRLDAVSSPHLDFAPAFAPDGRTLLFTSERPGMAPARSDGSRPPGDIWSIALDALGVECDAG